MCHRHIFLTLRHIGAATMEAQKRIGAEIVEITRTSKKIFIIAYIPPKQEDASRILLLFLGAFRRGNKPPVLPGEEK